MSSGVGALGICGLVGIPLNTHRYALAMFSAAAMLVALTGAGARMQRVTAPHHSGITPAMRIVVAITVTLVGLTALRLRGNGVAEMPLLALITPFLVAELDLVVRWGGRLLGWSFAGRTADAAGAL